MASKIKVKLPRSTISNHPGVALLQGIRDLEACEKSRKYVVDMGQWHSGIHLPATNKCEVCFAGSVMAQTLKIPIEQCCGPEGDEFAGATQMKLLGLDDARNYAWWTFLDTYNYAAEIDVDTDLIDYLQERLHALIPNEVEYQDNKRQFKANMKKAAHWLIKNVTVTKYEWKLTGVKTT